MARLSIRVDLDRADRLGPGKVLLLERLAEHGSVAAAGPSMGMSCRCAWALVAATNAAFRGPLVEAGPGGPRGGARLTGLGASLIAHYRAIDREAARAAEPHLDALDLAARAP